MVSVIIPSYNSENTIAKCLDALSTQSYKGEYEIILVDSSTDRTPDIVRKNYPSVQFIHLAQKTDPGTARNLGLKKSNGDPVLFIDSDCEAAPDWMEKMTGAHLRNKHAAVGGGVRNGNNSRSTVAWAGYIAEFREFIPEQPLKEVDHIPTCNISYKREIFDKLGGFNPKYYPQEDLEFNLRLINSGKKILFDPQITIRHHHRTQVAAFFRHQKIIGKITSKMLRILPLEGSSIARSKIKTIVLMPVIPLVKWFRTITLFLKLNREVITKHPLAALLFAVGLFPWIAGFMAGVFSEELFNNSGKQ